MRFLISSLFILFPLSLFAGPERGFPPLYYDSLPKHVQAMDVCDSDLTDERVANYYDSQDESYYQLLGAGNFGMAFLVIVEERPVRVEKIYFHEKREKKSLDFQSNMDPWESLQADLFALEVVQQVLSTAPIPTLAVPKYKVRKGNFLNMRSPVNGRPFDTLVLDYIHGPDLHDYLDHPDLDFETKAKEAERFNPVARELVEKIVTTYPDVFRVDRYSLLIGENPNFEVETTNVDFEVKRASLPKPMGFTISPHSFRRAEDGTYFFTDPY